MFAQTEIAERTATALKVVHDSIHLHTEEGLQFIDLTDQIAALVEESGVRYGIVNVQTRHTTTAVIVNEHEPLLLEDMKRTLARLVPRDGEYQHNNFAIRTFNLEPDESPNGHSHCQGLLLSSSATLNILGGEMHLGRWQRIFFIELDHARPRTVSVMILGQAAESPFNW